MPYRKSLYITLGSVIISLSVVIIFKMPSQQTKIVNFIPPVRISSPSGSSLVEHHIIGGGGAGHGGIYGGGGEGGSSQSSWPVMVDPVTTNAGGDSNGGSGGKIILGNPYDAIPPGGEGGSGIPEMDIIPSHTTNPVSRQRFYPMK